MYLGADIFIYIYTHDIYPCTKTCVRCTCRRAHIQAYVQIDTDTLHAFQPSLQRESCLDVPYVSALRHGTHDEVVPYANGEV